MATPSDPTPAQGGTTAGDRGRAKPAPDASLINRIWHLLTDWWVNDVAKDVDQAAVLRKIASDSSLTPRYIFMICMSAGIAILGLLLSSPAVVIGAMLLSPLMGPILGAGFALAVGKVSWLKLCSRALIVGTIVAVLFCALIVLFSPLQTVTSEIAARTRPNLFDLLVALFSSLAGSYAMIRGREGTIVGVAIATALMPPLATVGFGLATLNWTVFGGALMLFVTNFLTIALSATVMARLYGFRAPRGRAPGRFQNAGIVLTFIVLAIPLGLSLRQIAWESNAQRVVANTLTDQFDARARVSQQTIDWDSEPLAVTATVLTPKFLTDANARIAASLSKSLGRKVEVNVNQLQVDADPGSAEQATLTRARAAEAEAAARKQIENVRHGLALVAGVTPEAVTIDREGSRALVTARPLPGLDLAGYRTLEQRVADSAKSWEVRLRPPLTALPAITLKNGQPDEDGARALALIRWAAQRTELPLHLSGPAGTTADIAQGLRDSGVAVSVDETGGSRVTAGWDAAADGN